MMGLTKRQADCLDAIRSYIDKHGFSPSYSDLCRLLGCKSKSTVTRLLERLQERGYVQCTPNRGRSLRLTTPCRVSHPPPFTGEGNHAQHGGGGAPPTPDLQARLARYCAESGEADRDVIADAVLLHLDEIESDGVEDAEALAMFGAAFDTPSPRGRGEGRGEGHDGGGGAS